MHRPGAPEALNAKQSGSRGFAAKKALGQHFLFDPRILKRITDNGQIGPNHTIIEIGPGPGGLTRALLDTPAQRVVAVEKDQRFADALRPLATQSNDRLSVLPADALTIDIATLGEEPRVIIANLPYNVATPILIKLLEMVSKIDRMVLMFQKEVAQRITAVKGEKNYGRLAVMSQWVAETNYAFTVVAGSFSPPPKVDSGVVTFAPRQQSSDVAWPVMEKVVATAFGQRRKMLRRALKPLGEPIELLEASGIDPELRAEDVPIAKFESLARAYATRQASQPL